MNYYNLKHRDEVVSFSEAVLNGLGQDKGLYFPEQIPYLNPAFIKNIENYTNHEIALTVLSAFTEPCIPEKQLRQIITNSFNFEVPVEQIEENMYQLELFHGPTQAFKDIGARFISECLHFLTKEKKTVLVATSGDTGGAVANAFYNKENLNVVILFPSKGVSFYQKKQMCSHGKNIYPLAVEGDFDDCQNLVKMAFSDAEIRDGLSAANSINIARLLPQMVYYFWAYKVLKSKGKDLVLSVPSGNYGNLCAGLMAHKMGLPIKRFIAAGNQNKAFYDFISSGEFVPLQTIKTIANAMDVGSPNNFPRIYELFEEDHVAIKSLVKAKVFDDDEVLNGIQTTYLKNDKLLEPHSAIGKLGLKKELSEDEIGIFLGTASPVKFSEVLEQLDLEFVYEEENNYSQLEYQHMPVDYTSLKQKLQNLTLEKIR